jgi:hypothetical protein
MEKVTKNNQQKWTNKELLEFYKSFPRGNFVQASLADEEMRVFIYAVCFYLRSDHGKRIYFEKLNENYVKDIVSVGLSNFLADIEYKIDQGESDVFKIFDWIFKDSELVFTGGIYSMEEAIYAMRDEILGVYVSFISSKLGMEIYMDKDKMKNLKEIMRYNKDIHSGVKYNCYTNHLISSYFSQMIIGSSMVFQKVIEIEEVGEFDTFCDKFEPYLHCILNLVEIDGNSIVSEEDFSTDIEKIINFILGKNDSIINNNYELVE